ncbi:MAG TPA: hypothetical protein VN628_16700 [Vicinamibacterales bacterium]|nr:hypothetical protein [Vicinamibacterales bacterium]
MTSRALTPVLVGIVCVCAAGRAYGQPPAVTIVPPIAGACRITLEVPAGSRLALDRVTVDGKEIDSKPLKQISTVQFDLPLKGPLLEGDALAVDTREPRAHAEAVVGRGVSGDVTCRSGRLHGVDDRDVFELDGFYGLAIDNFAPKEIGGYPSSASSTRSRRTFGVIGQYRLFGDAGDHFQVWIEGATLNGLRTADVDCTQADQNALCKNGSVDLSVTPPKDLQTAGVQVMQHASSLEAHIGVRAEFFTLQAKTATPVKAFAFYRHGFIDVINPVLVCNATANTACAAAIGQITNTEVGRALGDGKTFSAQHVGIGGLIPAGHFRDSGMIFGLAKEDYYGTSHAKWSRLKLNALAIFDVLPQLQDFSVTKWMGFGSWRGFIAFDVDRDGGGLGPDSIETYVGFVFDLSKAFHL